MHDLKSLETALLEALAKVPVTDDNRSALLLANYAAGAFGFAASAEVGLLARRLEQAQIDLRRAQEDLQWTKAELAFARGESAA